MKNASYLLAATMFLLWGLLGTACQKTGLPPDSTEAPVFMVTPDDISQFKPLTAGVDSVYLFTRFTTTGQEVVCKGSFAKENCPAADCPESLTFEFKGTTIELSEPSLFFNLGQYAYLGNDSTNSDSVVYRTVFYADTLGGATSFSWTIDDQLAGTGSSFELVFLDDTPKRVELEAVSPTGLRSKVRRLVSLAAPGSSAYPQVNIQVQELDTIGYQLTAEVGVPQYDTLVWSDGSNEVNRDVFFLDSTYSVFVVQGSNVASAMLFGLSASVLPARSTDFTYTVEKITFPVPEGKVAIQWVDKNGMTWRTDGGKQDGTAVFEVSESAPYDNNELGQKTRSMRVSFRCDLFNATGERRPFAGEGNIAVAYP